MNDVNRVLPTQTQAQSTETATANLDRPAASDGVDRRNFLSCMAWAGTGLLWTMAGGVPASKLFAATDSGTRGSAGHGNSGFSFVQISDSHIGFS